ncbi:hypothetical protein GCM10027026_31140 [Myroides odoratimimus subsp. xuanwuensis]
MSAGDDFGVLLRDLRQRAGLTQAELAERAGLSPAAISALERGVRSRPYPHTRAALARALDLHGHDRAALEAHALRRRRHTPLPAPVDELVGRETEVDAVVGLLGTARVVTLTGPGGVGKTRLALRAAERAAPRHPDGAAYVALAPLREPAEVLPAVAIALGVADLGPRDLADVLARRLRTRRVLLVLDNAEHLPAASPLLSALVAAVPGLTVLTTSRAPLGIRGEHVHLVPPLDPGDAAALFRARARQAGGAGDDDAADVAALCVRLDHLPLAIEIAAAHSPVLPAARLSERLDAVMLRERSPWRDAPARQRTLAATVRWSLDLLPAHVREVLHRLAVAAGSWTLDAASAVAEVDPADALDAHVTLVAHGLLVRVGDEPRFAMLATVRAVLLGGATDHGEDLEAAADRHAAWYCDRLLAAGPELWGPQQADALVGLDADHAEIRVAARRLLGHGRSDELAAACASAVLFWLVRGHLTELGQLAAAGLSDAGSVLARARWHYLAGWSVLPRGRFTDASEHFAAAVRSAADAGAATEQAWARVGAAYAAVYGGDLDRARTLVAEVEREVGGDVEVDVHLYLTHLIADAHVRVAAGDVTGASALLSNVLPQAERTGSPWTLGVLLGVLGRVRAVQGDPDEAHAMLTRSVRIFGTLGDTWGMAHQLTHLADAAALRDEPERAALLYGAVDGLADEVGAGVFPVWRDLSDHCQARAVEALGLDVLTSLRRRGRELGADQVLRLASGDPVTDVVSEPSGGTMR